MGNQTRVTVFILAGLTDDSQLKFVNIMNSKTCIQLVLSCWVAGFFVIFPPLIMGLNLVFCASNIVDHFYCDTTSILQISCSDIWLLETMGFISALVTLFITLIMVISYIYIALTIVKILSTHHRKKAFSTCSSHMIVISIFYGSCIIMYIKPSFKERISFNKGISVLNTSVAPILNPLIYTLMNQQVKKAFMNMVQRIFSFLKK